MAKKTFTNINEIIDFVTNDDDEDECSGTDMDTVRHLGLSSSMA